MSNQPEFFDRDIRVDEELVKMSDEAFDERIGLELRNGPMGSTHVVILVRPGLPLSAGYTTRQKLAFMLTGVTPREALEWDIRQVPGVTAANFPESEDYRLSVDFDPEQRETALARVQELIRNHYLTKKLAKQRSQLQQQAA